jgi:hypothetical protein
MELTNLVPNQQIAITINGCKIQTTIQDFAHEIADTKQAQSVEQGIESLDQGLTTTVNLAGVSGYWNGVSTTIDLI